MYGYLRAPKKYIPGTKKPFEGVPNEQDRCALVAYLKQVVRRPPVVRSERLRRADDGRTDDATKGAGEAEERVLRSVIVLDETDSGFGRMYT